MWENIKRKDDCMIVYGITHWENHLHHIKSTKTISPSHVQYFKFTKTISSSHVRCFVLNGITLKDITLKGIYIERHNVALHWEALRCIALKGITITCLKTNPHHRIHSSVPMRPFAASTFSVQLELQLNILIYSYVYIDIYCTQTPLVCIYWCILYSNPTPTRI